MDSLRYIIRKTLSEAVKKRKYYTTWRKFLGEDREDIDETAADIVAKVTKSLGIEKYSPAGSGTQGYAYYIPNNKILKITTDRSEVIESKKIQGKKCKFLSEIYNTYTLKGKYNGVYVIVCELLTKSEKIDEANRLLDEFLSDQYNSDIYSFFYGYSVDEDLTDMFEVMQVYFKHDKNKFELASWYFKGMAGIVSELHKYNIKSQDFGVPNLGIKKDGNLAMHDFGNSPSDTNSTDSLHIDEEAENMSRMDYPDFLDTQYNKNMGNSPYPPLTNPNRAPMRETEISPEELNKKNLPIQYHNLWSEFLESNTEALADILPTLRRQYSNLETLKTVKDVEEDNPALYDEFADWIFQAIKLSRQ